MQCVYHVTMYNGDSTEEDVLLGKCRSEVKSANSRTDDPGNTIEWLVCRDLARS